MSEGQPKVSLRRSQVPLPVVPRALPVPSERPPSASMPPACVRTRRQIKHEGTAPVPPAQPPFVSCSRGVDLAVVSRTRLGLAWFGVFI